MLFSRGAASALGLATTAGSRGVASTLCQRLMATLCVVEGQGTGELDASAKATLVCAQKHLPKPILAVVASRAGGDDLAKTVSSLEGVEKVVVAEVESGLLAEPLASMLHAMVEKDKPTHVVAGSSTFGKNLAPRLSAMLDVAPVTDVTDVVDDKTFVRPIYAGNALSTVKFVGSGPVVMTVRATAFGSEALAESPAAAADVRPVEDDEKAAMGASSDLSAWVGEEKSESERPLLDAARVVISGGRALKSAENFKMLERLADQLSGAVGASRAAVDAGMCPNDMQVGQTGKVVAPELYIAVGISGAVQHLAGMKDSKTIVAINKDPESPIFKVADYGLVGDLFSIVPELSTKLEDLGFKA